MTVRFPLRISTTCDALLDSFASLPATKKPQNAWAGRAGAATAAHTTSIPATIRSDMPPPWLSKGGLGRAGRRNDLTIYLPGARVSRSLGVRHQRARHADVGGRRTDLDVDGAGLEGRPLRGLVPVGELLAPQREG